MSIKFEAGGKAITIDGINEKSVPLVFLNCILDQGTNIYNECIKLGCPEFTLASMNVTFEDWDKNMAPWYTPKDYPEAAYCNGQADKYLDTFLNVIAPEVIDYLPAKPTYIANTGYSLAGLFSVYSTYKTDMFERIASASGSFWFPGFIDFVKTHKMVRKPSCIYFSLGSEESHSSVKQFDPVEVNTEWLAKYYAQKGIKTTFVINPGNHYFEPDKRMANAIKWMLEH